MGNVVISPNLKKRSDAINANGDYINPRTKQVVAPAEEVFVPTPEQLNQAKLEVKPEVKSDSLSDKIQKMIEEKVNKIVEKKIEEALKNLL